MADRVVVVHGQARRTLGLAVAFTIAAAATTLVPHRTGWWLPLHLFFAGGLVLAISGASQLFAVTWSAGVPPSDRVAAAQRWAVAAGAVGVAAAREVGAPAWVVAGAGSLLGASLAALAALLTNEVRRGRVRRFDPFVRYYQAAAAAGLAGALAGTGVAAGRGSWREAHVTLMTLGLVGLVVAGTLPFFTATQARMKMSRRATARRLRTSLVGLTGSLGLIVGAASAAKPVVTGVGLLSYAGSLGYLTTLLPRPGRKQLRWAGPRIAQLVLGVVWWVAVVVAEGLRSMLGDRIFGERSLAVLALGGYLQVLLGSLAYLAPVLVGGGHERLGSGLRATRSWPSLIGANTAAIAVLAGRSDIAGAGLGVVVADVLARVAALASVARRPDRSGSTALATEPEPGERLRRHPVG